MHKYQIVESRAGGNNAFSKAPRDVSKIVETCGFKTITISASSSNSIAGKLLVKLRRIARYVLIFFRVQKCSVIFVQYPCFSMQIGIGLATLKLLKIFKKARVIILVHDADEFRYGQKEASQGKCKIHPLVKLADRIIVHNARMRDWYQSIGVEGNRLYSLDVFDYVADVKMETGAISIADSHTVVIASNLDPNAAVYLKFLKAYSNLRWELFGPNFSEQETGGPNVMYNGVLQADELPGKLPPGFGLVWYGDSKETCNCYFKEYLKIINPHKTSAYLASGLPVIVWKDMGVADFVKSNGVGFCVNSLDDIEEAISRLTLAQLRKMQVAVNDISQKLRNGYYTKKALETCLASMDGTSRVDNKE